MTVPHPSKRKGDRVEREIVEALRTIGVDAHRVPLSGAVGGDYSGDLRLTVAGRRFVAEVKARAGGDGFKTLEKWLAENDLLVLRRDRAEPLIVLPWATFALLVGEPRPSASPAAVADEAAG